MANARQSGSYDEKKSVPPQHKFTLTEADHIALQQIEEQEENELAKCKKLTRNTVLSVAEYAVANPEFKTLIKTPWGNGEPIYIMPVDEKMHPLLRKYIKGIQQGAAYHTFVTESYGEAWPILLRLYYGLKKPVFKISIEQLHSMMKLCYWRALDLRVEMHPVFKENSKKFTPNGARLMDYGLQFYFDSQRENFIAAMQDKDIPRGESSALVIFLNIDYARFILYAYKSRWKKYPKKKHEELLENCDTVHFRPLNGPYSHEETSHKIKKAGAAMLSALFYNGIASHRVFIVDGLLCVILPSQTVFKNYLKAVNPNRKFTFVRRLGPFGPDTMEYHSDRHERAGALVAPGIKKARIVHRKVVTPAMLVEHDDYHHANEGQINTEVYSQLTRAKEVLRDTFRHQFKFTAEIFRFIDREGFIDLCHPDKLFHLLQRAFSIEIDNLESKIAFSSVIVLVDMILNPKYWPYYAGKKNEFIQLLLPNTSKKTYDAKSVEAVTQDYAKKTKNNLTATSILLLCHFYLNKPELCQQLLAASSGPFFPLFAWRHEPHGMAYPVLVIEKQDYRVDTNLHIPARALCSLRPNFCVWVDPLYDPVLFKKIPPKQTSPDQSVQSPNPACPKKTLDSY